MDVRMPDGTIIRGVPEGTTKEQLLARYQAKMASAPATSDIDEEIKRRRERLERNRALLSKEPTGVAGAVESVLNFLGSKSGRQESLARLEEQTAAEIAALQNRAAYIQRTGQAPRELTTGEAILEVAKAPARAAVRGVGDVGGVLGIFGRPGERAARAVSDVGESVISGLGLTPNELAQFDPSLVRPTQFGEAVGSTIPLVLAQAAGRARIPLQAALGAGMGAAQQRREIEAQEARTGQEVSAFDRALAQAGGAAVGLSEMVPIPGLVAARPGRVLQRVARSAVEEGGQEAGAQAAQNIVEKLTYNPEQEISEGALESALIGGGVGAGFRGSAEAAGRILNEPMGIEPEAKPEVAPEVRPEVQPEVQPAVVEPRYYRETSPERASEFFPTTPTQLHGLSGDQTYLSDTPDLALGQGKNTGVLLEFDRSALKATPVKKPGQSSELQSFGQEYIGDNAPEAYSKALKKITVSASRLEEAKANSRKYDYAGRGLASGFERDLNQLEEAGWIKETNPDGSVSYTLPAAAAPTRETEEPSIAATAIGEAEETLPAPVSTRPFPTATAETADIEAPPAGYEPEREVPAEVPPAAPIKFDIGRETFKQKAGRLLSDDMQRLTDFEGKIAAERGAPLPRTESARDAFARYFGRATERLDEIDRDFMKPIVKKVADYGLSQERIDEYLVAKSAPARNEMIARINPEMPDGGAGMSTVEAEEVMRQAEEDGILDQLEEVAGDVLTMAKATREGMVRDGLITRQQADVWEQTQPYYVPLKGIAAGGDMAVSDEDIPHYDFNPAGFRARAKESMKAKGRGEGNLPLSPLAYTIYDAKAAAIRGEKNIAANKFLDLVMANPSNAWEVFTKENPDTEMVPDPNTGVLRRQAVPMQMRPEKYFLVKREGKPYYIRINDPLLMRALTNGSAKSTQALVEFLNDVKIAPATRTMARLFTTYNPVFAGVNYTRDMQSAIFNILAEQDRVDGRLAGKEIAGGVLRDMTSPSNFKKIAKITFNKEATTEEERQMFDLFQQAKEDGAFTGWIVNEPIQQKIEQIQEELDKASATGAKKTWYETKEGTEKVLQALQDFNSVFENITRFSVYKNALDAGLTRDEAANMAREVTVDFNKKGELGSVASTLYAFVNAAIQGNTRLWRSISGRKADGGLTRAQKLAITLMGMGAMQSVLGRAMSDDDEDGKSFYDKIPDYEKQRNIIIPHPWSGGETYTKIPLPYGISVFYNFGTNAADFATDNATAPELGLKTLSSIMNNFSPISVNFNSPGGFFNSFAPTVVKPFTDLILNENYFGSTIYNEPFREGEALSNIPRYKTAEGFKEAAKFVNEITGGQGAKAGWGDFPAEAIPYLLGQYTGGAGRFGVEVLSAAKGVATGDVAKMSPSDIPFINKIYGEVSENTDLGDYYDRITKMGPIEKQLKNSSGAERQKLLKSNPVETSGSVISAKKRAESRIKNINKELREWQSRSDSEYRDKKIDMLNQQKIDAMKRFNQSYNRAEERAR